jgi:hypothetical protein
LKKIWIYLLLFTYLSSVTELGQIAKFTLLIVHYQEHKAKDTSISIGEFLVMHYLKEQHEDGDFAEDMKLPFKSYDHSVSGVFLQDIPRNFKINISLIKTFEEIKQNFCYSNHFSPLSIHSIWQPPEFI